MISESPTFCSAPWTSLNINQAGHVFSCFSMLPLPIGNIKNNPIQEILSGPILNNIKQKISQGEWHENCVRCKNQEAVVGSSNRTTRHCDQKTIDQIDQNADFFELQHLVVNWSNLCNLMCVYCGPQNSTAWQAIKNIPVTQIKNNHSSLIDLAKEQGHLIQGLTLGGGEPLLQKDLDQFLQYLDPEKTNVLVTTNLTVNLEKNSIYNILKSWPKVTWMISFDNVDPLKFQYVRHGADWNQFVNNINVMTQDRQLVLAHPAYSIYCAYDLIDYYNFCQQHNLSIHWCPVDNPHELDVKKMSKPLRDLAIVEIDRVVNQFADFKGGDLGRLLQYRTQLQNTEYQPLDVIGWHKNTESMLNKTVTFEQLWPNLIQYLFY